MDEVKNQDAIEAARAEGMALGIRRGASMMGLYVMDKLRGTFDMYRENGDSILIDDAKMEVALCIGRAFKPERKRGCGEAGEPADH